MDHTPELLIIVRPGATERFRLLEETFAALPVRVMWDRRRDERRRRTHAVPIERRERDRRGRHQTIGHASDWVIVRVPGMAPPEEVEARLD